jgi:hypothetical protein
MLHIHKDTQLLQRITGRGMYFSQDLGVRHDICEGKPIHVGCHHELLQNVTKVDHFTAGDGDIANTVLLVHIPVLHTRISREDGQVQIVSLHANMQV